MLTNLQFQIVFISHFSNSAVFWFCIHVWGAYHILKDWCNRTGFVRLQFRSRALTSHSVLKQACIPLHQEGIPSWGAGLRSIWMSGEFHVHFTPPYIWKHLLYTDNENLSVRSWWKMSYSWGLEGRRFLKSTSPSTLWRIAPADNLSTFLPTIWLRIMGKLP